MPKFDATGCRIIGPAADGLELISVEFKDPRLDELREKYKRDFGFDVAIDPKVFWVGVFSAEKLVAAIGYIFHNATKEIVITDLLSDGSRLGKIGVYLLGNFCVKNVPKGTKVFGKCLPQNTQHRKFLEDFGSRVTCIVYMREF